MKQLIIIGAGGMGRTMYSMAVGSVGYGEEFCVKGFIDDNLHILDNYKGYPRLLSTIKDYTPQKDDVFICSIGVASRRACIEIIEGKGGKFHTLIHSTARILNNAMIGPGTMIGAYTTIGNDCVIGRHNLIQSYAVVGHDCVVGDFNRIDTHVTMAGGSRLENGVCVFTSAVINQGVVCENDSKVGALSFVIRNVMSGSTVMGNPAKKFS